MLVRHHLHDGDLLGLHDQPVIMKCGIGHYDSGPSLKGHTARTCPLQQTECRRSLPADHVFSEKGQCLRGNCVHDKTCTSCGKAGHQYGTQALTPTRWRINKAGKLVRKQTQKPLSKQDFVCSKMTALSIQSLINNAQSTASAVGHAEFERRASVSRLRGNVVSGALNVDQTIRVMQGIDSDAALFQGRNKPVFKAMVEHAHLGAIAAGRKAAPAVESDVESSGSDLDDLGAYDSDNAAEVEERDAAAPASRKSYGKADKAIRVHRGGCADRVADYASAVVKGRRGRWPRGKSTSASKPEPKSSGPISPSKGGKKKCSVQSHGDSSDEEAVDGSAAGRSDWPIGTREPFTKNLPVFVSARFGATPPVQVAHRVLEQLTHSRIEEVELSLSSAMIKSALDKHVRGYLLTSGTLSAALVSEWLCSSMPRAMRCAMLFSVAFAVQEVVQRESRLASAAGAVAVAGASIHVGASAPMAM